MTDQPPAARGQLTVQGEQLQRRLVVAGLEENHALVVRLVYEALLAAGAAAASQPERGESRES